jgi:hypothetical protein
VLTPLRCAYLDILELYGNWLGEHLALAVSSSPQNIVKVKVLWRPRAEVAKRAIGRGLVFCDYAASRPESRNVCPAGVELTTLGLALVGRLGARPYIERGSERRHAHRHRHRRYSEGH